FNFQISNPHSDEIRISLMATQQNLVGWDGKSAIHDTSNGGYGGNINSVTRLRDLTLLDMRNTQLAQEHPANGSLVLAVMHEEGDEVTHMAQWTDLDELWKHFATHQGRLPGASPRHASPQGETWNGALSTHFTLA